MLFRAARYYLRSNWLKLAAAAVVLVVYSILIVNNARTTPMTYEAFAAQYDQYSYIRSEKAALDRLAEREKIPRELLGDSFEEAYPVFRERHFSMFLAYTGDCAWLFTPVLAGGLAALFLCCVFRKRHLGPLLAAGCSRGAVYLLLLISYFGFFLFIWLVAVPWCFSRYRIVPLTAGQLSCLRLLKPALLFTLLFGAAAGFFFAFLLRRSVPAFLASVGFLFLVQLLSEWAPLPLAFIKALVSWEADTGAGPLIAQGCVTAAAIAAAFIGGWLCFRRQEV